MARPHTSASQLACYSRCPRQYRFRYIDGLESESKSIALVLGIVTHSCIGWFYEQRMQGNDPGYEDVLQIMGADLGAELAGAKVDWGEDAEKQHARINAVLLEFLRTYGNLPVVDVDRRFELERAGRPLIGYFDLILEDRSIVEIKTAQRAYGASVDSTLQFWTYRYMAREMDSPGVRLLTLIKTSKPRLEDVLLEPATDQEAAWFEELVDEVEGAISLGVFAPSVGSHCGWCDMRAVCRDAS